MMLALELLSDLHVDTQNGWTVLASKKSYILIFHYNKKVAKKNITLSNHQIFPNSYRSM